METELAVVYTEATGVIELNWKRLSGDSDE
jgi:hypothetical protein